MPAGCSCGSSSSGGLPVGAWWLCPKGGGGMRSRRSDLTVTVGTATPSGADDSGLLPVRCVHHLGVGDALRREVRAVLDRLDHLLHGGTPDLGATDEQGRLVAAVQTGVPVLAGEVGTQADADDVGRLHARV